MNQKHVALLAVGAVLLGAMSRPVLADNEKGTAVIKGKALFEGDPPKTQAAPVKNDPVCEKAHENTKKMIPVQGTIVYSDSKAIPYVFVYVKDGIKGKYDAPKEPVILDQRNCQYHPHVIGMVAGQEIIVRNSDPTNHNVHALPTKNPQFNFAQPNKGDKELTGKDTFNRPEMPVKVKCDVHPWMGAWFFVMTHPFFDVTKDHEAAPKGHEAERGTFEIKNLPAGEYEIVAWHETFGEQSQKVTVKDGETKEIEFKFSKKAAAAPDASPTKVATK